MDFWMSTFNDFLIPLAIASLLSAIMYFFKFREKKNYKDFTYLAAALPRLYLALIAVLFKFNVPEVDTLDLRVAFLAVIGTDVILSFVYLMAKKFIKEIQFNEAVENLKKLSDKFAMLLESATFGIFTLDKDGKIELCNQAFAQILETTREEVIGRNIFEFLDLSCTPDILEKEKFICPFVNVKTVLGNTVKVQVSGGSTLNGHKTITGSIHTLD